MSKALVHAFSDPKNHRPVRVPSFPSVNKTAVVGFEHTQTAGIGAGTGTRFVLTRSPTAPLWRDYNVGASAYMSHNLAAAGSDWSSLALLDISESWTSFITSTVTAVGEVTATQYIIGTDGNFDYAYLPQSCTPLCAITFGAGTHLTASAFLDIVYYRKGSEFTDRVKLTRTGNTAQVPTDTSVPAAASWWRPGLLRLIDETNGVNQTFSLVNMGIGFRNETATTKAGMFPVTVAPEFGVSHEPYGSTRLTAVSVCLTNVTREFDKEGWVTGYRMPWASLNSFLASEARMPTVDSLSRYAGPMAKGVYTFLPPDSASADFRRYHSDTLESGTVSKPLFNLLDSEYNHLMFLNDLDATDATTIGITLNWSVEFLTTSVLFPTTITSYGMEDLYAASRACARMLYFHENPSHVGFMLAAANKALSMAMPAVKNIGAAALKAAKDAAAQEVRKLVNGKGKNRRRRPPPKAGQKIKG